MKRLYHLHNDYGEFNEYTTDERKIIMIYIDEISQCVENNILSNTDEEHLRYAEKWLEEIMILCGADIKNEIDDNYIDELIKKLNKEHNWLIDFEVVEIVFENHLVAIYDTKNSIGNYIIENKSNNKINMYFNDLDDYIVVDKKSMFRLNANRRYSKRIIESIVNKDYTYNFIYE